jgi:hypothetical protein
MTDIFEIKRNDTKPYLSVTLQYANGSAVDLTGGSVLFNLARNDNTYATVFSGLCVITGSLTGECEYQWTASNTNRSGLYLGEFQINLSGGKIMTLPSDHSLLIKINEDYA